MNFFRERTIAPVDMKKKPLFPLRTGSFNQIGAREEQQDSFRVVDISNAGPHSGQGILALVADGMGGLSEGSKFSAAAADCVQSFNRNYSKTNGNTSDMLMALLAEANRQIDRLYENRDFPLTAQGGTTFLSAAILEDRLSFISVGDSRIYLMRGGALIQLNREHVYSTELDDNAIRGEITFEAAGADPQRRALTSYLGMKRLALIDRNLHPIRLLPKDFVLLMTDGVFGTLTEDEIASAVFGGAAESAERLEKAVLNKSKANQDNFTAIIIGCV